MPGPTGATGTPTATAHAHEISAVHRAGIAEGYVSFEPTAPSRQASDTAGLPEHRFAALVEGGAVLGRVAHGRRRGVALVEPRSPAAA